jgi:hypothetical protein
VIFPQFIDTLAQAETQIANHKQKDLDPALAG